MQLKINTSYDEIFEWIPYNQFDDIKEVSKNDSATLHSAIWINGPLEYNYEKEENKRVSNKVVALKCLNNSQNGVNEFMNEIKSYSNNKKIYGVSQNPDTKDYIMVLKNDYCKICGKMFRDDNWCKLCQMNNIRQNFVNWTSENEKIDDFIQEMQMRINDFNDIIVEWIPYNQFNDIKEIGKGGFSKVYSAIWMDGPLKYDTYSRKYKRIPNKEVALKILNNSQNISKEFLNEGGDFYNYINNYIINWSWFERLDALLKIISGLKTIHENNIVHRDFHTGNILASFNNNGFHYAMSGNFLCNVYISDMGLCEEANNVDKTKIYGVMPFVAPEVLRGKPYTQAADIYSFALNICNRFRPEINEQEAPKCYVDLMTRCWDSNPDNRPNAIEIEELIELFNENDNEEIKNQFENVVKYRMANLPPIDNNQSTIHPQACYTSRLLNPFTKGLTECLDCVIND
ncbi:kinase-like domain-containing protein [Rhizophagus clarus]|uniref:Kinase-like domain-containing protein n=1 Tax=Rhizophagus clarus TaxID=94130 RepID=A0A8H3L9P6_9GLOM|nr:kinase-like domain-containing protein [Rhizophagus clarus]